MKEKSYKPIIYLFTATLAMALATSFRLKESEDPIIVLKFFVAYSMTALAILKLQDIDSFSKQFIKYDIIAKKWRGYSYAYPFLEAFIGIGMLSTVTPKAFGALSFFVGFFGSVSVIKTVYIEKKSLHCACVGGNSKVPLGFISLTENLMMLTMGLVMAL